MRLKVLWDMFDRLVRKVELSFDLSYHNMILTVQNCVCKSVGVLRVYGVVSGLRLAFNG